MGDTPVEKSLSNGDVKPESIVTNTGLEVNAEWGVEITDQGLSSINIDKYRAITNGFKQEDGGNKPPGRLILINHKRIK